MSDLQEIGGFQYIFIVFVNQIGIGGGVIKFLGYFLSISVLIAIMATVRPLILVIEVIQMFL